jgi:hypothetical protein
MSNPPAAIKLALSLLMFRVCTDHAHHALAVDDLTVITHLFNGSPYFHRIHLFQPDNSGLNSNRGSLDQHTASEYCFNRPVRLTDLKMPVSANCGY